MSRAAFSLRNRLLLAGAIGVLLVSTAATWMLGRMFEQAARDALDRQLGEDLISLLALAETDANGGLQLRHDPDDQRYARVFSGAYWQVFDPGRNALLQSRSLWDETLPVPDGLADGEPHAIDLAGPMQQPLRALVQQVQLPRSPQPRLFVVAVDRGHIDQDVAGFRRRTAAALAVLTALWLAVLSTQVLFGLRPLSRLGQTAARVRGGQEARFPAEGLPDEVRPLAGQLNDLLDHHERMVQRARHSAADLAHALKTPLAVLMAESEGHGADWRATLRAQTRRMNASIERYLAAGVAVDAHQRTPVREVATSLAALLQRVHQERGVQIEVRVDEGAVFAGAREDLEEMLGNLLDNACKWAAHRITVTSARDGTRLQLRIVDDGPGLAPDQLQTVLGRGVRADERAPGSGLGLSIVEDIARSYDGALELHNAAPGLDVRLTLPTATPLTH